jgi:hypothetical protein
MMNHLHSQSTRTARKIDQIWIQLRILGWKWWTVSAKHVVPLSSSSLSGCFKSGTTIEDLSS